MARLYRPHVGRRRQALGNYGAAVDASSGRAQRVVMGRCATLLVIALCLPLAACDTVAIALLGGGASTLLRYNLDGVAARTFTAPAESVKHASLAALERMGLEVNGTEALDTGEVIHARAPNRDIDIEVEPITKQLTRVRIMARGGSLFYDNATALELVAQTEKSLDVVIATKARAGSAAAAGTARLTSN
jgi:Protein of unknown function (DUF3568)